MSVLVIASDSDRLGRLYTSVCPFLRSRFNTVDVNVSIATSDGLVSPVVRSVESKVRLFSLSWLLLIH